MPSDRETPPEPRPEPRSPAPVDEPGRDLERFVAEQDRVLEGVLAELRAGRKATHWMWFVFPQLAGLGRSDMARRYAIASLDEARGYLAHPVLGTRLRQCAALVLAAPAPTAEAVFGQVDARKLHSSMTLFQRAAPDEPVFGAVLDRYFGRVPDPATEALLATAPGGRAPGGPSAAR